MKTWCINSILLKYLQSWNAFLTQVFCVFVLGNVPAAHDSQHVEAAAAG